MEHAGKGEYEMDFSEALKYGKLIQGRLRAFEKAQIVMEAAMAAQSLVDGLNIDVSRIKEAISGLEKDKGNVAEELAAILQGSNKEKKRIRETFEKYVKVYTDKTDQKAAEFDMVVHNLEATLSVAKEKHAAEMESMKKEYDKLSAAITIVNVQAATLRSKMADLGQ